MTKPSYDSIGQFIKGNAVALSLQAISVVVLLANLWLASKLAPLASGIESVSSRVEAIESQSSESKPLIERFIKLETKTESLTITVDRIEGKVDRIIERSAANSGKISGANP